jgi:hypothetical protein
MVTAMLGSIGRRSDTVRQVELDDELTLFDTATGTALALNRTAREFWSRADGQTPVDDVVGDLAGRFHTAPEVIGPDVESALTALEEAGVLVRDS